MAESWDKYLDKILDQADAPDSDFVQRSRAFFRACARLIPNLSADAQEWEAVADAFDAGTIDQRQLAAMRGQAWQFHDERGDKGATTAELCGIRAAMWRLWPTQKDLYDLLDYFVDFCREAGLRSDEMHAVACECFGTRIDQGGGE